MYKEEKILLVDDEQGLLDMLETTFQKEGYKNITKVNVPEKALALVQENHYDIILLDVMMPGFTGFELCSEIRKYTYAPIIFLTACAGDFDKIQGLAIGADDYITKPFNPMEVSARVNAILRRQNQYHKPVPQPQQELEGKERIYDFGIFSVNEDRAALTVEKKPVECTAKEFELLLFFCKHPNKVFTSSQLYEAVWQDDALGDEKTVSVHILRLRKKLGDDPKSPAIIVNMRGIGYKFVPPGEE